MKKRIMIAALAVAAVFALSACKQDEQVDGPVTPDNTDQNQQTQTDDETDNEEQDIDYLSDLSTERYDGYEFRILIRKDKISDQYFEEPPEDVVDDAIYKRNKLVEEMYGITITATESSSNDYETDARRRRCLRRNIPALKSCVCICCSGSGIQYQRHRGNPYRKALVVTGYHRQL